MFSSIWEEPVPMGTHPTKCDIVCVTTTEDLSPAGPTLSFKHNRCIAGIHNNCAQCCSATNGPKHTQSYIHTPHKVANEWKRPAWRNFKLIKHTQMHLTHPDSHNIKDRHAHFLYGHMNAFHHQSNLCLSLSLWWSDDEGGSAYKATHSFLFITHSDNISP